MNLKGPFGQQIKFRVLDVGHERVSAELIGALAAVLAEWHGGGPDDADPRKIIGLLAADYPNLANEDYGLVR